MMIDTSAPPGGLLGAIAASVRKTVSWRREQLPIEALAKAAAQHEPRGHRFREGLQQTGRANLIAECKRRSPGHGVLVRDYRPAALARAYAAGGAAAISVLTEPTFFDGALSHLADVRQAVDLPILRKDFIVDEYQLFEARAAGADAVLLIVSIIGAQEAGRLVKRADELGLAALVEVHSADELSEAAEAGASIIGVNSRNLATLEVDLAVCESLAARAPRDAVMVAESGIRTRRDIERLAAFGYRAFLVGQQLVTAEDPQAAVESLVGPALARAAGSELECQ